MWIIFLTIFIFAKEVAGEFDCEKYFFDQCERPKMLEEIPRDEEVFKTLCPKISPYIECSRDFDMQCREEDRRRFVKPAKYDDVVAVFDEICEEGTVLNEILTSNLKCFNETFSNTNCPQEIYDFMDAAENKYRSAESTTTNLNDENVSCMSMILLANCIVKDVTSNCGIRARFVMSELVQRTHFVDSACPLSYRKSLLQIIDEFDLTEEQKIFATAELVRMEISE